LAIRQFDNDRDHGKHYLTKTIAFSLEVIKYVELLEEKRKFVIANQLLKSGTSIGANVHEAQNAESKADFVHKFKIAAKELKKRNIG
jgi:four helix bundle protein